MENSPPSLTEIGYLRAFLAQLSRRRQGIGQSLIRLDHWEKDLSVLTALLFKVLHTINKAQQSCEEQGERHNLLETASPPISQLTAANTRDANTVVNIHDHTPEVQEMTWLESMSPAPELAFCAALVDHYIYCGYQETSRLQQVLHATTSPNGRRKYALLIECMRIADIALKSMGGLHQLEDFIYGHAEAESEERQLESMDVPRAEEYMKAKECHTLANFEYNEAAVQNAAEQRLQEKYRADLVMLNPEAEQHKREAVAGRADHEVEDISEGVRRRDIERWIMDYVD